jgi:zinc transport system permease protein
MLEFLHTFLSQTFVQNAISAGLLASLACGIMGTYVVVRRISFISGGIAHSILGGMGIAYFFGGQPLNGAIAAALLAALITGAVNLRAKEHEDTIISAIWSIGMAIGIIFIARTPGYGVDLMSFLFGNILMVSRADLAELACLDGAVLALVFLFYRQFRAVCYDEEFTRLRGVKTGAMYLLLLALIALTVVLLIQVVGIILVIALLTLPAAISGGWSRSLGQMMAWAVAISVAVTLCGLGVSYAADLPSGATIIILAGAVYLAAELVRAGMKRFRHGVQ